MISKNCTNCRLRFDKNAFTTLQSEKNDSLSGLYTSNCVDCCADLQALLAPVKSVEDDTDRFMRDVSMGISITMLAAPAAVNNFPDYRQLFGYLHSLGVRSFQNVLLRADITIWAYIELLRCNKQVAFLSSPCAAVTEYIRRHKPKLLPYLMPVYSPLLCTIIYLQKYHNLTDRIAFLSPCVAKRKELRLLDPHGYNITINSLQQYIANHNIDLSKYKTLDFADRSEGTGRTLSVYGSVSESIAAHLPDRSFVKISGPDKVYRWLEEYERRIGTDYSLPHLAELYNCRAGCEGGTGINPMRKKDLEPVDAKWLQLEPNAADSHRSAAARLFTTFKQTLQLPDFLT
ncbi:MAG: hydrogenase large subunit domain protein [Firmicutes bacterium]|nr:hydrogenase large subunit domain protein [Bacillota bacterium]